MWAEKHKTILGKVGIAKEATGSYIDDLLVDATTATREAVISHLNKFGIRAKHSEPLEVRAALGHQMRKDPTRKLVFRRENQIPDVKDERRRELFSTSLVINRSEARG